MCAMVPVKPKALTAAVRRLVRETLEYSDEMIIDNQKGFFTIGMDSLMAVELANHLQKSLAPDYEINSTIAFDYPSITDLSHYINALVSAADSTELKITQAAQEPIVVIGMACRLPGDVDWQLLCNKTDATTEIPQRRWDINHYYDPDPDVPGKMVTRRGAFLDNIEYFDADFLCIKSFTTSIR